MPPNGLYSLKKCQNPFGLAGQDGQKMEPYGKKTQRFAYVYLGANT